METNPWYWQTALIKKTKTLKQTISRGSTWCTFTHIFGRAFWLVAHSVILTLLVFAGSCSRGSIKVKQRKGRCNLAELARETRCTHAGIGSHSILARGSIQADMWLTIIDVLGTVLAFKTWWAFTPVERIQNEKNNINHIVWWPK